MTLTIHTDKTGTIRESVNEDPLLLNKKRTIKETKYHKNQISDKKKPNNYRR
jgi:hypothetical protein